MINHLIQNVNEDYDFIAHIRPTSPQRNINDLIKHQKFYLIQTSAHLDQFMRCQKLLINQ